MNLDNEYFRIRGGMNAEEEEEKFCSQKPDFNGNVDREMAPEEGGRESVGGEAESCVVSETVRASKEEGFVNAAFDFCDNVNTGDSEHCHNTGASIQVNSNASQKDCDSEYIPARPVFSQENCLSNVGSSPCSSDGISAVSYRPRQDDFPVRLSAFGDGALRVTRPFTRSLYGCRYGVPLHRRRLWFARNWAALELGCSVDNLSTNNSKRAVEEPAFPDAELGQNNTGIAEEVSDAGTHERRYRKSDQNSVNVSAAQGDVRDVNRWSADRGFSPAVYSIGVFYSDTDQCGNEDKFPSPDDELGGGEPIDDSRHGGPDVANQQVTSKSVEEESMARGSSADRTSSGGSRSGDGANVPLNGNQRRSSRGNSRSRCNERRAANSGGTSNSNSNSVQTPDPFSNSTESVNNMANSSDSSGNNALPDILNSHLPPPYSTLPPPGGRRLPPPSHPPPPPPPAPICGTGAPAGTTVLPGPCPHSTPRRSTRGRGAFRGFPPRDRLRSSGRRGPGFGAPAASESDEPKHCCGVMVTQTVSIRWFIVMIAFVGLCCAIVGTVLGALKATGREHLTVSLLMIGVGIVLITVSGIAWRLTSHDAPSCRAMLGLQSTEQEPNRRFVPRVPPYGRPHHPYAAMMYPEFQYRPPPPSYQASMQEYRLRLLLLDRQQGSSSSTSAPAATVTANPSALSPVSPPPTYRSHTSSTIHSRPPLTLSERDYSRPPSYRSRASSAGVLRPSTETLSSPSRENSQQGGGGVETAGSGAANSTSHSRDPSLSLSFLSHESLFVDSSHSRMPDPGSTATTDNPVHFTSPSGESQNSVVAGLSDDSPLTVPDGSLDRRGSWTRREGRSVWALRKLHDVNAVTIVQTTDSSQVLNQDTVILSIPGHSPRTEQNVVSSTTGAGEVQILAHV